MPTFRGTVGPVGSKTVAIEGETLEDAMVKAGYIAVSSVRYGNQVVGCLSDGRRYRFKYAPENRYHTGFRHKRK